MFAQIEKGVRPRRRESGRLSSNLSSSFRIAQIFVGWRIFGLFERAPPWHEPTSADENLVV